MHIIHIFVLKEKQQQQNKNCTKTATDCDKSQVPENKDLLGEIAYRSLDEFVCAYMFSRLTICSCSFWLGHTYAAANLCMFMCVCVCIFSRAIRM